MDYFFEQMREILGERYNDFVSAYETKPRHKALRVNTIKISVDDFRALAASSEYSLKANPLCAQSFYTSVKPSLDPLYHAGLYYMQEPSASAAVEALSPFIGERVLDLCAAPGGKSTQAAAKMKGGVIFCNDVDVKRVGALEENIARLGIKNAVTTCASALDYRRAGFDGYFDTLIVDAPCSGGGMMRYENVPYSAEIVAGCAARQRDIIDDAVELLSSGGYMLYSTCTFAPEEDERNVEYIIEKGFEPIDIPLVGGAERGMGIPQARRLYPHNFDGEGHFFCVLKKTGRSVECALQNAKLKTKKINVLGNGVEVRQVGENPAIVDFDLPASGLRYRTVGVNIFERGDKNKISYAYSHVVDLSTVPTVELDKDNAVRYLQGEQIALSAPRGDVVVTHSGFAIGMGKCAPDGAGNIVIKNLYPKSLRI
ncbi:MAG: hypothetical protein J1G04_02150 [Clostridiales bacterium]|nr:hypothetical protein [Clostridiales bacterium]